jgi:hypothetical protein
MAVARQHRPTILTGQRGDPDVVGGNRCARIAQLLADGGIVARRGRTDLEDGEGVRALIEPALITLAEAGPPTANVESALASRVGIAD